MKTFEDLKEGDIIFIIDVDKDNYNISVRKATFIEVIDYSNWYVKISEDDETSIIQLSKTKSIKYKMSNKTLTDLYYISDIEYLESFIKDLLEKISGFKEKILDVIETSWEILEEEEKAR